MSMVCTSLAKRCADFEWVEAQCSLLPTRRNSLKKLLETLFEHKKKMSEKSLPLELEGDKEQVIP